MRSKAETPYKSRRVELALFDSDSEGHRFESCRAYSDKQPSGALEIRASGVFACPGNLFTILWKKSFLGRFRGS